MKYDACRSTVAFPNVGQTLYMSFSSPSFPDLNTTLTNAVNAFYNENMNVTQADIDVCCGGTKYGIIARFLTMMQDKTTSVGCAVSRFTRTDGVKATLIACNYAQTNFLNVPVYVSGPTASQCISTDLTFTSLCAYVPTTLAPPTTALITTPPTSDYCAICPDHIVCHNNGSFYSTCPTDATMVVLDTNMRNLIVHTHNLLRNKVASGNQVGYNSATKMFKMVSKIKNLNFPGC